MEDMQLFGLFLPHLTFFLDVAKRCGFMSEELKDSMSVGQPEFSGILELRHRNHCACWDSMALALL